jgi:hypothetical protein
MLSIEKPKWNIKHRVQSPMGWSSAVDNFVAREENESESQILSGDNWKVLHCSESLRVSLLELILEKFFLLPRQEM